MCPASKSQEADEILKYENNQEKLITNQTKTKYHYCFALYRTVKPSDLGDLRKRALRETFNFALEMGLSHS